MSETAQLNPYAPPSAPVIDANKAEYQQFNRISTWWVWLLVSMTFGLYEPYWLYTRGKLWNTTVAPSNRLETELPLGVLLLFLGCHGISIIGSFYALNPAISITVTSAWCLGAILNLISTFHFRGAMNECCDEGRENRLWVHGFLTFFFKVIYLNYKLNQRIDAGRIAVS